MAKRRKLDVAFAIPMQHGNDIAADSPLRALNIPASTAIAATSTAPKFFDKIPAEIRIMIYEFAYSGEEPLKIKATWPVRPRNVCSPTWRWRFSDEHYLLRNHSALSTD